MRLLIINNKYSQLHYKNLNIIKNY